MESSSMMLPAHLCPVWTSALLRTSRTQWITCTLATESKLVLNTRLAKKLGDGWVVGARNNNHNLKRWQTEKVAGGHPREPFYLSQNSGFFYTKMGRGVVVCCKLLGAGIFCSCTCSGRSVHDVPVNLQQVKCCSVLQLFISLWMEKWYALNSQSLENGLSCISQIIGSILNSKQKQ